MLGQIAIPRKLYGMAALRLSGSSLTPQLYVRLCSLDIYTKLSLLFSVFVRIKMASTVVAAGVGLAVVGFAGRYLLRQMPNLSQRMAETMKRLDSQSLANSKYYKGGFEQKMTRREASLILGVSPTASKAKVKEQFKKVMGVNHPDRGGSPYIAAKINEAKDLLEKQ